MMAVVDYGVGNVGAVLNMLRKVGAEATASRDPSVLASASGLILPGVGAFDHAMARLEEHRLTAPIRELVTNGKPLLGICIGMQMLGSGSEEGSTEGLGLVPGYCRRFRVDSEQTRGLKVPHMGWTDVRPAADCVLFDGLREEPRFYFVHSYHLVCEQQDDVAAVADYGGNFTAAVQRGRVFGVQFHPEKSHKYGMAVLKNFARIMGHGAS